MRRGTLIWTLFPPLLVILVLSLALVTGFAGRSMRQFFLDRTQHELRNLAVFSGPRFQPLVAAGDEQAIQDLCRRLGDTADIRITVILPDGRVVGDSDEQPAAMDNHADRPEIAQALAGKTGSSTRFSATLDHLRMYVAVPQGGAGDRGPPLFVTRTSISLGSLAELIRGVYLKIGLAGLLLALLAGITSYLLSRSLSRALGRLQDGAEAYASGDLSQQVYVSDTTEISAVADAMNHMARQLDDRISTIDSPRTELEAVLSSMVEGVLAVDEEENLISLNEAAAELLGQDRNTALGRSIQEIGRNPDLTSLAQQVLAGGGPLEKDIRLGAATDRWIQIHATGLVQEGDLPMGALLVMNDITRIRRLENMRRDFVANVSHELKTPITSIQGYVETLIETPPTDREGAARVLEIIHRQADRLTAIITDLLSLSRLEFNGGIELRDLPLNSVLDRVVRDLANRHPQAANDVHLDCRGTFRARINAPLIEQAVANLLDNAVKYSPAGRPITLACQGVFEKDGVLFAKATIEVVKVQGDTMKFRTLRTDGSKGATRSVELDSHWRVKLDGREYRARDLSSGQRLNIYLPQDRFALTVADSNAGDARHIEQAEAP